MNGQDRLREEPTIDDARRWFARMPNPLTFVGWKEHIFEAMINHAGDVILPNTNAADTDNRAGYRLSATSRGFHLCSGR